MIPITLICNILRVQFLLVICYYFGLEHANPDAILHTLSGIVMFLLGIFLFIILSNTIQKWTLPQKSL